MPSEIQARYPADQPLTANVEFMEWIAALEKVIADWGARHEGDPYSLPLIDGTGLECWHDMFVDGYSPQQAFDEDRSNWQ